MNQWLFLHFEAEGRGNLSPSAAFFNPSSSESGGVQPNKCRVFSISICKDLLRRCATSGLPTKAAASLSQLADTGINHAGRPMAWPMRRNSSLVETSSPSDTRKV